MKNYFLTLLLGIFLLQSSCITAQEIEKIEVNTEYKDIPVQINKKYLIHLVKGRSYDFSILQQGIDVEVYLQNKQGKELIKMDSPNGSNGYEKFEYVSMSSSDYYLLVKPFDVKNESNGKVSIKIQLITENEIKRRESIRMEVAEENKKNVQTLDIDHFWEAFDELKKSKTRKDSINVIQKIYLDRATSGLQKFISVRPNQLAAERFVEAISKYSKFYNSIRKNTFKVKESEQLIEELMKKLSEIYPNFKPFKVCFAVGTVGTGGTVSNRYVLIGSEITTSTKDIDLSEFKEGSKKVALSYNGDILQKIKNYIAHEGIHTQQKRVSNDAIKCSLLEQTIKEGAADFIGELLVGEHINKSIKKYGDPIEEKLWNQLKSELCNNNLNEWLYNGSKVKNKPADLGYYIGYKMAQEYYKNSQDKPQAIIDIIEMNNPFQYLEKSGYDKKFK